MKLRIAAISVFALAGILLPIAPPSASQAPAPAQGSVPSLAATPVLLELFTSEGCSTCPPAEALLARLGREQFPGVNVIALEEHVDYWDRLGWKDPYSSAEMTARQQQYAQALSGQVFTPEMVADGRTGFVGSSPADAIKAIFAASATVKPAVRLAWTGGDNLAVSVEPVTDVTRGDSADIFLAIAESKLHSDVKRGENAGRGLDHSGVVRRLVKIGKADAAAPTGASIKVPTAPEWNRANLRAVVFIQERRSRHVLTAAAIPFLVN